MMSDGGSMWFGGGFMWIIWIFLIFILIWFVKSVTDSSSGNKNISEESPLEILKKRYARGEIEEQEYERRRKDLER